MFAPVEGRVDLRFLYAEIFEQRCYEQEGVSLVGARVVLDLGANVGMFARRVREVAPDATVYCFEPVPVTRFCLERNLASWPNARVFPFAVADREGTASITYYPRSPGNATLRPELKRVEARSFADAATIGWIWSFHKTAALALGALYPLRRAIMRRSFARLYERADSYRCETTTLDAFFVKHPLESVDLLKVDVEGAECAVFSGISDLNLRRVRQLAIEITPSEKASFLPALQQRLRTLGFDLLALRSIVPGSDPSSDALPCTLYARRCQA